MPIIDLTVPLREGMPVWPGDPALHLGYHQSIVAGKGVNVTEAWMGLHTGTHIDAPNHFLPGAGGVETLVLDTLIGPARVIEIEHPDMVTAEEIGKMNLSGASRFLIKTRNSSRRWWEQPFDPNFCHMTEEAAKTLLEAGMILLGVDCLSVDAADSVDCPVHTLLLPVGVVLLEGLNLAEAAPGDYELMALPALFEGRDAAPARAVLKSS